MGHPSKVGNPPYEEITCLWVTESVRFGFGGPRLRLDRRCVFAGPCSRCPREHAFNRMENALAKFEATVHPERFKATPSGHQRQVVLEGVSPLHRCFTSDGYVVSGEIPGSFGEA
ncbi:hypothetical protein JW921_05970 [Candidatus Fermentibacterales bacterium]|nr:hypothetical protein [Candidatus Fermentibacterales bacterium]